MTISAVLNSCSPRAPVACLPIVFPSTIQERHTNEPRPIFRRKAGVPPAPADADNVRSNSAGMAVSAEVRPGKTNSEHIETCAIESLLFYTGFHCMACGLGRYVSSSAPAAQPANDIPHFSRAARTSCDRTAERHRPSSPSTPAEALRAAVNRSNQTHHQPNTASDSTRSVSIESHPCRTCE